MARRGIADKTELTTIGRHGPGRPIPNFECGAFNHSATSPKIEGEKRSLGSALSIGPAGAKQGNNERKARCGPTSLSERWIARVKPGTEGESLLASLHSFAPLPPLQSASARFNFRRRIGQASQEDAMTRAVGATARAGASMVQERYRDAGVDTDEADAGLKRLTARIAETWPSGGGFGSVKLDIGYFANVID